MELSADSGVDMTPRQCEAGWLKCTIHSYGGQHKTKTANQKMQKHKTCSFNVCVFGFAVAFYTSVMVFLVLLFVLFDLLFCLILYVFFWFVNAF